MELAKGPVSDNLKAEKDTAVVVALQLRRENIILRAINHRMKEDTAEAFNDAKEALSEVIATSKYWVGKAFEMLAEPGDIPRYEHRPDFQESFHRGMVAGKQPPIFQESLTARKMPRTRKGLPWTIKVIL